MGQLPKSRSEQQPIYGKTKPNPIPPGGIYRFGAFDLNPHAYELRCKGMRLHVSAAPMDLLILLVERRGALVSREDIAARLWAEPSMVDVDQGINTAIRRVREVLRDDPTQPRFIETVVGKGYRFIADVRGFPPEATLSGLADNPKATGVSETPEITAASAVPAMAPVESQSLAVEAAPKPGSRRLPYVSISAVCLLIVAGAVLGWRWRLAHRGSHNQASLAQITSNDSEQRVTAAAISPDGKWIAYADVDGISLLLLASGKIVPLKAPESFVVDRIAWFPDQTRILVSGFDSHSNDPSIWTVFITGNAPQQFRSDARNGAPAPDGSRVAFTTNRNKELWTAGADGESAQALIADGSGEAFSALFWSTEGKRISYLRSKSGLLGDEYESADAVSGKILARAQDVTFNSAVALSDGRLFFLRDAPEAFGDAFSLWEVKTNRESGAFLSAPVRAASLDKGRASGLTASDDGTRMSIVFAMGRAHVYVGDLQQPGPTLTGVRRLTFDTRTDYPGSWLHDSDSVVFESDRTGIFKIYKQRLEDRNPQEINSGGKPGVLPQVTPDGAWILFASIADSIETSTIYRVPAAGIVPEHVALNGPAGEFRCPLRAGSTCVLLKVEDETAFVYYAFDPLTGIGRELARTAWLPHVRVDWCVSPDGSAVALTYHDPGNPRIRIVPLNPGSGLKERELPVNGFGRLSGIDWAADGKGWFVAADRDASTQILYVSLEGKAHVLRSIPFSSWGVPSPDGKKLAFVDRAVDSNVWMWRLEK